MKKINPDPFAFHHYFGGIRYGYDIIAKQQIDVLAQQVDGRKCKDCGRPITSDDIQAMAYANRIGSDVHKSPSLRDVKRDLLQCWVCLAREVEADAEACNAEIADWYDKYGAQDDDQQIALAPQQDKKQPVDW